MKNSNLLPDVEASRRIELSLTALRAIEKQAAEEFLRERAFSHAEMISRGADGVLSKAYERHVPLSLLDGLEPRPSNNESDDGDYHPGKMIKQPIEVAYDRDLDVYMVHAGNHRIAQAQANGQTHILAFVEPDRSAGRDYIGSHPKRKNPDASIVAEKIHRSPFQPC